MDFIEQIRAFAAGVPGRAEAVQTEEATKTALILPFFRVLGYDTSDPREVVPEFTADFGTKKGQRVDYAIFKDNRPVILVECKAAGANLDQEHASQLFQYFAATDARFGVLTNGVVYRFYSDLDQKNKMDTKPFFEFNMLGVDDSSVEELQRFTKPSFDLDTLRAAAAELKYTKEIKRIMSEQLKEPSDDFVRFFASQIYSGRITQSARERFGQLTRQALNQFINDRVYDRLKSALPTGGEAPLAEKTGSSEGLSADTTQPVSEEDGIVTTEEELQAYFIVKAILHGVVDVKRIAIRNLVGLGNSVILLDNTIRKPICRLWFKSSQKYLGLVGEEKKEEKIPIDYVDDIYAYADRLKATVGFYETVS